MSENIIINTGNTGSSNQDSGTPLNRTFTILIWAVVIILVAIIGYFVYLVVDNWEWIVTTLTTGFIGWLNPFDSDEGDVGPGQTLVEETGIAGPVSIPRLILRLFT